VDQSPACFATPAALRTWLRRNHATAQVILLRIAKQHAASRGVTYSQALDEALCYGWIDGIRRAYDADFYTVRFTPRKRKSIWSRVNIRHAERLIEAGRMTPAGLKAFEARTEDRTGVYSFETRPERLPRAEESLFRRNRKAWAWYQREAPWYRRTTISWVMSGKREETRHRRLEQLIACSAEGSRIPALRRGPAGPAGKG
jgi:uncharacterized protein YdeI (YjbR/CyaY-like superfamily)